MARWILLKVRFIVFEGNKAVFPAIHLMYLSRLMSSTKFFGSDFIYVSNLGGAFSSVLWRCHEKIFMVLFRHFIDITCFVCETKKLGNCFMFAMSFFNFFWNVSFTDQNLVFGIMYRNSFTNASISLHCSGVHFDLNPESSLRIYLCCFL